MLGAGRPAESRRTRIEIPARGCLGSKTSEGMEGIESALAARGDPACLRLCSGVSAPRPILQGRADESAASLMSEAAETVDHSGE